MSMFINQGRFTRKQIGSRLIKVDSTKESVQPAKLYHSEIALNIKFHKQINIHRETSDSLFPGTIINKSWNDNSRKLIASVLGEAADAGSS